MVSPQGSHPHPSLEMRSRLTVIIGYVSNEGMARPNKHRLTCDIDLDIIQGLDSIVEQDRRYWHRTHLINEALQMFIDQWEADVESDPYEDASEGEEEEEDS